MHTPAVHAAERPAGRLAATELPALGRKAMARAWLANPRTSTLLFVLLAVVACAVLVYLGRGLTFFGDEWEFITARQDLTVQSLFNPHNEHWSLFPVLAYKVLLSVVGLHSYLPYLGLLLTLHVTAVAALFVLLRRLAGPLVAIGGAALVLLLGKAYEDLFWAFQIGFVGSIAAGLWALVVLHASVDRRSLIAVGSLLFVTVASSGIGLAFLVAAGTLAVLDPSRRRGLVPVAAVGTAYLVWFVLFGRSGLDPSHAPLSMHSFAAIPAAVITGGGRGIGGLIGRDLPIEQALFALLVASLAAAAVVSRRVPVLAVAAVAAIVTQFFLIGLTRDPLVGSGAIAASAPRYVYSSAVFVLLALAALLGGYAKRFINLKQAVVVTLFVGFCLVGNVMALHAGSLVFATRAGQLRAAVAWVAAHPDSPMVRANVRPTPFTPDVGVSDMLALASREGSVTRDDLFPDIVPPITPAATDEALFGMVKADFQIRPMIDASVGAELPRMIGSHDVATATRAGCIVFQATGPAPRFAVAAAGGTSLGFVPGDSGKVRAYLGLQASPQIADSIEIELTGGQSYAIAIPDAGVDVPWTLTLIPTYHQARARLCGPSEGSP
jgi:hypothetical protein